MEMMKKRDSLEVDLLERLCNLQKLSRNEVFEKCECFLNDLKNLNMLIWFDGEYDTLFDFIYTSMLNLKSSQNGSDENLIKLVDSLLRLLTRETGYFRIYPITDIRGVLWKKLRFLRDYLLSNELEIWEYLFTKICSTIHGIAVFVLILCYSYIKLAVPTMCVAIFLVCEIEVLEQEIQEACYCEGNLKLEGLSGLEKYQEIFVVVLRQNAIELLDSMSCLFHHPHILNIHGEIEHLTSFLEDLPKVDTGSQSLNDVLSQIGELNIKTRLVIHKLISVNGMSIIMDNELPLLIEKAKLIRAEIEKIPPLPQLPMPSHIPLTNGLAFIVSLLQNLRNVLNLKIDWIATINDDIKLIYEELEKSSLFLKETSSNQHTWPGFIDDLQTHIIQVAYKAECVVDSIMLNDAHLSNLIPQLYNVREEVMLINEKIAMFHDEKEKEVGLNDEKKVGHIIGLASSQFMTNDEEVVGFQEETQMIIDQLTRGAAELDVISIIGMPGIGKTTLARKVYFEREIINHFDIQAWCTVSQNYDKKELLFETYKQVCKAKGKESKDSNFTEDKVADDLRKSLMGNRYLIVLDDIWDIEVWDDFNILLSGSQEQGSRIIITSRLHEVASYAKLRSNPLLLHSLNQEESWELLLKKTFHDGNFPKQLSRIGKTILGICKGLPLMIVLVAGILSRLQLEACQWDEVAKNLVSHVTTGGEDSMTIIELSYKHLPDYLKPCFLYFGAFKEDEEVSVSKLIMLWIAEGFVRKSEQRVVEDVAKEHLNALISCSLVMVTRRRRCSREAKACVVHDLVLAFCIRKAKEENFLQRIREGDTSCLIFDNYRLSIGLDSTDYNIIRLSWVKGSGVRSFVWISYSPPCWYDKTIELVWIFYKFKLLRILDLSSICIDYPKFYSGLDSLLHLRYLALYASDFHKFPSNLLNLQTLLVRGRNSFDGITLPQTIWHMVHVRHIKLPLFKLHGDCWGLEFFDGPSGLDSLQCIATVELKYCDDANNILRKFPNLRKIKCRVKVSWDDAEKCYQFPKLDFLHQLESLHMFGNRCPKRYWFENHYNFYLPPNLRRLKLDGFLLLWREISVIPTLANLEKLVLRRAIRDEKWNVEDCYVFPNLKILGLHSLPIREWVASANSFPRLEELVLSGLYFLKEIPSCFEEIYTLTKIEIFGCMNSVVVSVMKIKEEIEEAGGGLTVHVADIRPD